MAQRWWALKETAGMIQWYHFTAWVPKNTSGKFQPLAVQGGVDGMAGSGHAPTVSQGPREPEGPKPEGKPMSWSQNPKKLDLRSIPRDELGSRMRD